ncbi:hypothetical protein WCD74_14410 [Actinomycetospora sp. OC33-EN08]|uniref:Uncharacterized protein n=1 Tax=Actinomycetospora aurantiaca TaxID=3129233 RepID=A0ABU8MP78_9PSEU
MDGSGDGTQRSSSTPGAGRPAPAGGYAAWVAWIDAFRRGDDGGLEGLAPIDGRMGTYVEARLLERLSLAFSERVRAWQGALGERIVARPPADDAAVAALLREALPALGPLVRVADSPVLPHAVAAAMHDLVAQTRAGAEDAVRESARRLREPELQPRLRRSPRSRTEPAPATPPAGSRVPAPRTPGAVGAVRPPARPATPQRVP